jgi:hypothetical protein
MPNRIIREGWIDSERISRLSAAEECFFLRLCLKADDFGRYTANLKLLKSALYPLRDDVRDTDIARNLAAAQETGLIRCYEVEGKRYLVIPDFRQRNRASTSKFPDPSNGQMLEMCPTFDRQATDTGQTPAHVVGGGDGVGGVGEVGRAREAASGSPSPMAEGADIPDRPHAIAMTTPAGIDPEFAGYVWDDWAGRGGKDGAGNPRKWLNYVTTRWTRERKEWTNGTHKGNRAIDAGKRGAIDRNAGTAHDDDEYRRAIARKIARR